MKLITEQVENVEYICEDVGGKKNYKIRGVFLQSEIKNRNGRTILEKHLLKKLQDIIKNLSTKKEHLVS